MSSLKRDLYDQSISALERYAKCVLKDPNLKDKETVLQGLASHMAYFCSSKQRHEATESLFQQYIQGVEEDVNINEVYKTYEKELKDTLSGLKQVSEIPKYKQFLTLIHSEGEKCDDEEIMTVSQSINRIDPISKKEIVDPVKNVKCSHTYEKESILKLLQANPNTRCPMVGCHVNRVKKQDLVPDEEFKKYLKSAPSHGF